jgi:elongation factor 2 kinase
MTIDIQGVDDNLTDPCIHTQQRQVGYGIGNLGKPGMLAFLSAHTCNNYCKKLNLPEFIPRGSASGS